MNARVNVRRLLGGLILIVGATVAQAADLVVIANPSLTLTGGDVREIYLGEKQFAGSVRLAPVDNSAAQEEFLRRVLSMEAAKYNATWTKKGFRDGVNPPSAKSNDLEVIDFVKRTPGAVGYISSQPPAGVNVVQKY